MDWKNYAQNALARARRVPRWVWPASATGVLATALLAFALHGSQAYGPLFEGLSAKQGGQVINELQKLGIPYELNAEGSIIRVPESELARARLQLAQMDLPANADGEAWNKLVQGSLTASDTAQAALSKRALEDTLERSIEGIRGVGKARVTLALPRSTPFLASQPHPKGSVWLRTAASGISPTQARAIAQMVANSVPGLQAERVTVTDQNGDVLAPAASSGIGRAQQQLAFESQIESRAASHVQALLSPLIGADNFRVSAAASVDFSRVSQHGVIYGPKWMLASVHENEHNRKGPLGMQGVPGALSNQPPGNVAAFLGSANAKAAERRVKGKGKSKARSAGKATATPKSSSDDVHLQYDVDRTTTATQEPGWRLKALSVSVVLNRSVIGAHPGWTKQVKSIISNAISAPQLKVNVAVIPFGINKTVNTVSGWRAMLNNTALVHALIEALAALLVLFGVAKPLARWLKETLPALAQAASPAPVLAGAGKGEAAPVGGGAGAERKREHQQVVERARSVAQSKPQDVAETLKAWIKQDSALRPDRADAHNTNKGEESEHGN